MQTCSYLLSLKIFQRLVIGSLILFSFSSQAEITIEDSGHVLQDLADRVIPVPFEQAMACPQKMKFSATATSCQIKCNARYCSSECEHPDGATTYDLGIEDCTGDSVGIYGGPSFATTLTKEEYIQGGNTWLIGLLKGLSTFLKPEGKVILSYVGMRSFKELKNGQQHVFFGEMISAKLQTLPGTVPESFEIGIDPSASGLNQILILRTNPDTVFLKRKGIIDVGM